MSRILVHVEGITEETFVNTMLSDHLVRKGYQSISARLLGNARQRSRRGGIKPWSAVRSDIIRHLREDQGCISTTMVDYYGLPDSGDKAWPGRADARAKPVDQMATTVEAALHANIAAEMGSGFDSSRFVPFVVMHEFEGLLFSDCAAFAYGVGLPDLAPAFQHIREQFVTPEEINDSPNTAPSKRILGLMPEYEKSLYGNSAALEIGLVRIRQECPHFNDWLGQLEGLASQC